jgi:hypothetical protein
MCFLVFSMSVNLLEGTTSRPLSTVYTDIQGRGYLSIDQALVGVWDTYGLIHPSQWLRSPMLLTPIAYGSFYR